MKNAKQYEESEAELIKRGLDVTNGSPELVCCITSDMTKEQRRSILRAARKQAKQLT